MAVTGRGVWVDEIAVFHVWEAPYRVAMYGFSQTSAVGTCREDNEEPHRSPSCNNATKWLYTRAATKFLHPPMNLSRHSASGAVGMVIDNHTLTALKIVGKLMCHRVLLGWSGLTFGPNAVVRICEDEFGGSKPVEGSSVPCLPSGGGHRPP